MTFHCVIAVLVINKITIKKLVHVVHYVICELEMTCLFIVCILIISASLPLLFLNSATSFAL